MRNVLFVLLLVTVGCHSVNKITGVDDRKSPPSEKAHAFFTVACCQDSDGSGGHTYPAFLPASQVELCFTAAAACHSSDCEINGDTYLPIHNDCGHGHTSIGDNFYPPTGY